MTFKKFISSSVVHLFADSLAKSSGELGRGFGGRRMNIPPQVRFIYVNLIKQVGARSIRNLRMRVGLHEAVWIFGGNFHLRTNS